MIALKSSVAAVAALTTLAAGLGTAAAQDVYYRPLNVAPRHGYYAPPPAPGYYAPPRASGYNPYAGPGAIVTAPVHFAGTLATLPFRAVNTVFPPEGNTPLVVVGAPVYVAGKLVELPFRIAEAPFGGPDPFQY